MSVPALRFKEFASKWEEMSLGEVSNNVMYGMNAAAIAYDGLNKYVRITDIDEETREFIPSPLTSPDGKIEDKYKLKNGDLVFARTGASVGKSYLYKEKDGNLLFAGFLVKFSITDSHPYFVYTKTLTESYKGWLVVTSVRSGQAGINAEELKEFKFFAPQIPEQTKIANFLTAVDEKISHLTQKYDLLTQYKKGVMQQIFSQALRFKDDDGQDFPEWEEMQLGDIVEVMQSGVSRMLSDTDIGLPVIRSNNLINDKLDISDLKYWYKIDNQGVNLENYFLKDGDLLVNFINSLAQIGKVALYENLLNRNTIFTTNLMRLSFRNNVNTKYIACFFQTNDYIQHIQSITKPAVNQASFTTKEFKTLPVPFPSIQEQTKIANFLTAIDDKITATQSKLQAVKQYKQGLLQQMFV